MPIDGLPPLPSSPPPSGTAWVLQRNVLLHSLDSPAGIDVSMVGNTTTYEVGNNGPIPVPTGAADFALARLYFAQFKMYENSTPTGELAAVDWTGTSLVNNPGATHYAKIDGGAFIVFHDTSVGSTATWPLKLRMTWTCYLLPPMGVTVEFSLIQLRADIWAALPITSSLPRINPTNPGLDPEQSGLELTWSRRNSRVPRAPHRLGEVAALTWHPMWDGAKRFLLDGAHLQVDALKTTGGYEVQADWYFIRIPGDTDTTVAPPPSATGTLHPARFDTDVFDDGNAVFS